MNLPSGGYIIIEPTEALVSIDVNTGRYTGKKDPEKTILKTNVDAAREIARQLRLRDIGGIIVCDFIDMESKREPERVLQELRQHLARDRARTQGVPGSELGLIEMTRQRVRPSLYQSLTEACAHCGGTRPRIHSRKTVIRRIERVDPARRDSGRRRKSRSGSTQRSRSTSSRRSRSFLKRLEQQLKLDIDVRDDPLMRQDEFRLLAGPADSDVTVKYALG